MEVGVVGGVGVGEGVEGGGGLGVGVGLRKLSCECKWEGPRLCHTGCVMLPIQLAVWAE